MTNKASGPQLGDSKQRNDRIESTAFSFSRYFH